MSDPRVKAGLWVSMALRMGNANGRFGAVLRKGDADAGGILVVLRGQPGLVVLSQTRVDGEAAWLRGSGPAPVDQAAADAYVERQVRVDPDLWVLEFESRTCCRPSRGGSCDRPPRHHGRLHQSRLQSKPAKSNTVRPFGLAIRSAQIRDFDV